MTQGLPRILTDKKVVDPLNRPRTKIEPYKDLGTVPLLRHIMRLSFGLPVTLHGEPIAAVGIYARRYTDHDGEYLWYLEAAKDSGYEGVACVDDTARALVLAAKIYTELMDIYQKTHDEACKIKADKVRATADRWANFLLYMMDDSGRIRNFILDQEGTINTVSENSQPGGAAWATRAVWGFAHAYKAFGDKKYLDGYLKGFVETAEEMSYLSLCILSALEVISVDDTIQFKGKPLTIYVSEWAQTVMEHFDGYFCHKRSDGKIDPIIYTYAYYELEAMTRVAAYLKNDDYLKAVQQTIKNFVEPNLAGRFYTSFPKEKGTSNLYGTSSIITGLLALHDMASELASPLLDQPNYYATLALAYTTWMYRENPAGAVMWYPHEGLCLDNAADDYGGDVYAGTACGAESAIEGGYVQLGLNKLRGDDRWL